VARAGGGGGGKGGPGPSATASMSLQDQMLRYTQCMRTHGVDVPDPGADGGGVELTMPSGAKLSDPKVQVAMQACQQYLPSGGAPPSMSPQSIDQLRKYTQCLRDHGIEVSDPDPNTGAIRIGDAGDKTKILNDPKFTTAQAACQGQLPEGKGGGK
jgi:hypothetical protein